MDGYSIRRTKRGTTIHLRGSFAQSFVNQAIQAQEALKKDATKDEDQSSTSTPPEASAPRGGSDAGGGS